ncbi:MAG: hypothetical protein V1922_00300 [bacterium]
MFYLFHKRKGGSLIELIMIFALTALLLPVFISSLTSSREGKAQQIQKFTAVSLLKETAEAVKSIKERGWSLLPNNGTYHPSIFQNKWVLSSGSATLNGFTTSVVIGDVYRDADNAIVTVGGILDTSTKSVVSTVSWTTPLPSSLSVTTYITRFRDNITKLDTTTTDFNLGSSSGTTIASTLGSPIVGDGEVTLGAGGHGNWCSPSYSATTVDLPKNGVANAIWAIEGKVSAATGDNASGVSFANVLIDNSIPPGASIEGTFDGYKTNGVYIDNDYAYIGTDTNSKEVVIIDLHQLDPVSNKYAEAGYFNVPGISSAKSVYVSGTIGFVVASNKLYTFNLTSKAGSRTQLGSVSLAGTGTKVFVLGSYAYVSLSGSATEMQIIQVANGGSTLTVVGQADVNGQAAYDVTVNSTGTRAYLATGVSASQRELFIIDISVKTGNRPMVGSYDSSGMNPKGVALTPGNRAILVGSGGEEYQVVNIANETNPVRCGGMDIPTGVNGISSILESDGDAFSYIITGDSTSELKLIIGGPGGQYATAGEFTSGPITATAPAAFNRFYASANEPVATSLKMQVAVANAVSGSCANATYTFIGPDINNPTTSYFFPNNNTIQGVIPFITTGSYVNPGRCFKYKAYMTTSDVTNSPVLSDITINYSP